MQICFCFQRSALSQNDVLPPFMDIQGPPELALNLPSLSYPLSLVSQIFIPAKLISLVSQFCLIFGSPAFV